MSAEPYQALLLLSFGGPEKPEDVMPFLENVLRGRNVPQARMLEVAEHYYHFGGVSPINAQNRALIDALRPALAAAGIDLPVYFGNRNWHPLLPDTLREMQAAGVQRALAFFTSMFSCYSGCRQYRENVHDARAALGDGAPVIDKLRFGFNHPGFIDAMVDHVTEAWNKISPSLRDRTKLLFTAHSIPLGMARASVYEAQLREAARLISSRAAISAWELVYQSRSGPPQQPWLEPDIVQRIETLHAQEQTPAVVIAPLGFISDHMEVLFDLDEEAAQRCAALGIEMQRARTVGTHPRFVDMIVDLIKERLDEATTRQAIGLMPPWHDLCPVDCCHKSAT